MKADENNKFSKQALHDAVISSNVETIWNAAKERMLCSSFKSKNLTLCRYQYKPTSLEFDRYAFDEAIEILEKNGFAFRISSNEEFVEMILDYEDIEKLPPYKEQCKNFKKILSKNE